MTIITHSKKQIDLLNLRLLDIDISDIAHSLAHQCRFNGHTTEFYSVAEHCVHVAQYFSHKGFENRLILAALLHDAAEAYIGDMIRPLKNKFEQFSVLEKDILQKIFARYEIYVTEFERQMIANVDNLILVSELNELVYQEIVMPSVPITFRFQCWNPVEAKIQFLNFFYIYANEREVSEVPALQK